MRTESWDLACLPQEKQEEGKDSEGQPTTSTPESEEWNSSQPGMMARVYIIFMCGYTFGSVRLGVRVTIVMVCCTYTDNHKLARV